MSHSSDFEEESEGEQQFNEAAKYLEQLVDQLDQGTLLDFYGLYKQSTIGVCNIPKPGIFSLQAKAKWNAWHELGDMSKDEAMLLYVNKLNDIKPSWNKNTLSGESSTAKWVSVSRHQIIDDVIADVDKTCFDYVKDGDAKQLLNVIDGIDLNAYDNSGLGLIHWASDRGNSYILEILLKYGANIHLPDSDGQTALHYSASLNHLKCVELLLKYGADRTIKDNENETAFNLAECSKIKELLNDSS